MLGVSCGRDLTNNNRYESGREKLTTSASGLLWLAFASFTCRIHFRLHFAPSLGIRFWTKLAYSTWPNGGVRAALEKTLDTYITTWYVTHRAPTLLLCLRPKCKHPSPLLLPLHPLTTRTDVCTRRELVFFYLVDPETGSKSTAAPIPYSCITNSTMSYVSNYVVSTQPIRLFPFQAFF